MRTLDRLFPEEGILKETARAFADSLDIVHANRIRNLSWDGMHVTADIFLKQSNIVGSYNKFNPEVAERMVEYFGDSSTYRLARESSVAVYVKTDKDVPIGAFFADEIDRKDTGEIRFWWD